MIFNKQALLALGVACAASPFSRVDALRGDEKKSPLDAIPRKLKKVQDKAPEPGIFLSSTGGEHSTSKGGKNPPNSSNAHKESTPSFFVASAACAQKCISAEFEPDTHLLTNAIQHCDAQSSRQTWHILQDGTFVKFKNVAASGDSTGGGWCLGVVPPEAPAPKNIVEIAVEAGIFNTLVAAVTAADLAETLSGEGPFTVLAPTDDAFAALPEGTVESLLADIPLLSCILTSHVIGGIIPSTDVTTRSVTSLSGHELAAAVGPDGITFDGSKVIRADIAASNGIIHVIDSVIVPTTCTDPATPDEPATTTGLAAGMAIGIVGDGWEHHDMCSNGSKLGLVSCDHPSSQWYSTDGQLISTFCWGIGLSSFLSVNEECTDLHLSTADGATAISRQQTFMAVTQEFIETIPPPHVPTYYPTDMPTKE